MLNIQRLAVLQLLHLTDNVPCLGSLIIRQRIHQPLDALPVLPAGGERSHRSFAHLRKLNAKPA